MPSATRRPPARGSSGVRRARGRQAAGSDVALMMTAARAANTLLLMATMAVVVEPALGAGAPLVEPAQDSGAATGNGPPRVALFPFANISQVAADDWIGAGIAETLASDLAAVAGLSVIALESAGPALATLGGGEAATGGTLAAMEVARRLGVSWIVVGAFQRIGDRLRITARVVEVATARVVQAAKIDGLAGELFALQDQLVAQIRDGLAPGSDRVAPSAAPRVPTTGELSTSRDALAPGVPIGTAETSDAVGFALPPGFLIDGPPPPVAPETISRKENGGATIRAVRIQGLVVDGALDDVVYTTVPSFGGFIQTEPTAGAPATERTEAWVFFDDTNLYIAARLWDAAPESEWVVNEMRRDSVSLSQNEGVGILLDTFYDRRNGLFFTVDPIGGRVDGQVTNERSYNPDWNPVWILETGRFEGGWLFEAAIPFKPGFPICLPQMAPLYTREPPSARNSVRRTIVQLQRPSPQPTLTWNRPEPLLSGHFSDTAPHLCPFFASLRCTRPRVSLPAPAAPRSSAASRRRAAGSDDLPPAGASSIWRASPAGLRFSPAAAGDSSATSA